MPGIAGIITTEQGADHRQELALMLQTMAHEPFYVFGSTVVPDIGVYAGWIAHPGSFAEQQSKFHHPDGIDVVFAGECVEDAPQRGAAASGRSVAGVYRTHGAAGLEKLNGVFSGLIVDRPNRRALLFNDRYGVERVYVHETRHATYFASEAKALLSVVPSLRAFDEDGVADLLVFGAPLEGRTLFRGISHIAGGSLWTFQGERPHKGRYFDVGQWESQPALSSADFQVELQNRFASVVQRYVGGVSQLGISLTGGVDTRLIMACLPALPVPPVCYTFAGPVENTRDVRVAARVASVCGLEHHVLRLDGGFFSDFARHVERTVYVTDACAGALGAHEMYLNRMARLLSPIRLTGNFGSEVLREMSTFKPRTLAPAFVHADFQPRLHDAVRRRPSHVESPVTFAAFREIPWSLFGTMAAAKSQVTFRTPYLDNDIVALAYQTPLGVRRSPDPALALVRQYDARLARIPTDRAVSIHGRGPGYLLRRAAAEVTFKLDYMHKEAMPSSLERFDGVLDGLYRAGLAGAPHRYLPYRRWFRSELAPFVREAVTDADAQQPFLNQEFLQVLARDHVAGRTNYVREIGLVVTLAAVRRSLLRFEMSAAGRSKILVALSAS